jgi:hypothetical protein
MARRCPCAGQKEEMTASVNCGFDFYHRPAACRASHTAWLSRISAEALMASVELPHWLMIAGAFLVVGGFIGALISGKKADEVAPLPDEPTDTTRHQMSPLPKLLDSKPKNKV